MKPFNFLILAALLAMIVLTRLYQIGPTDMKGLSLKNLVLYFSVFSTILVRKQYLRYLLNTPGLFYFLIFLVWVTAGVFFISIVNIGTPINRLFVLERIKNQLIDPLLVYCIAFLLGISDKKDTNILQFYLIILGFLNVVALTIFISGINPFSISVISHGGSRFASYGGLSNHGAYLLIFLIPFYLFFLITAKKISTQWMYLLLILTTIIGISLTGSRGGYILFFLIVTFYLLWSRRYKIFFILSICSILIVLGFSFFTDFEFLIGAVRRVELLIDPGELSYAQTRRGMTTFFDQISAGRTWIWKSAFSILFSDLFAVFLGKGWGTFNFYMGSQFGALVAAHNVPLKILFESGVIGLGLFLYSSWCFFKFFRFKLKFQEPEFYFTVLCMFFVVFWYFMLSNGEPSYLIFGIAFGLLAGTIKFKHKES